MSSGREWSVSIYTLLHLGFHRHKPSEEGIKGKEKEYARGDSHVLHAKSHVDL